MTDSIRDKEEINKEDYMNMSNVMKESFTNLEEGKLIKARVIKVTKEGVFVDVGYKSDGLISAKEFLDADGNIKVVPGDEVEVLLEKIEDKDGILILSKLKADRIKNIDTLERTYKNKDILNGRILKEIRGGYIVDLGYGNEGFLPNSQFLLEELGDTGKVIGRVIPVKVIKFGKKKGEIVISHKVALKDKNRRLKKEIWDGLQEGDIKKGAVKGLTAYGAFIDINGITGLLHISDMAWGKVSHPAEILALNSEIEVKVIKIDRENKRISLGLKQLKQDPWERIEEKYPINSTVKGKVVNTVDYGVFIRLEEGIEGLLHVSDMSWTKKIKDPNEIVVIGDTISVKILNIDRENRKILFGLKQLESDPFLNIEQKIQPGSKITGVVTGYSNLGIFIEFEDGIEGIIHKKDLSWTKRYSSLKGLFRKGENLEVVVLNIDKLNRRINLGLKQLTLDPWTSYIPEKYKENMVVVCKVIRITSFGIFVELEKDIEGFVHKSEISEEPAGNIESVVKIDEEKHAKIIKVDKVSRKISLSIKQYMVDFKKTI